MLGTHHELVGTTLFHTWTRARIIDYEPGFLSAFGFIDTDDHEEDFSCTMLGQKLAMSFTFRLN